MTVNSIVGSYYPPDEIIKKVSEITEIPIQILMSPTRKRKVVEARQIAMYFMLTLSRLTEEKTGEIFGGKDHSTVNWARKVVTNLKEVDKNYKNLFDEIKSELCRRVE